MSNIAIVGAGQLGSRHLQGVLGLDDRCDVHVVDPSARSLEAAEARAREVIERDGQHRLSFHDRLSALPLKLDYCVIATSSDVRLGVLRELLRTSDVRFLLLEKVLFQREQDYADALTMVGAHGARAWVNCTRRIYPIYLEVAAFLRGEPVTRFSVGGGTWGLGCNVIHFLDLFVMLGREAVIDVDTSELDTLLLPSKREGFWEFTGILHASSARGHFSARSSLEGRLPLVVDIQTPERSCVLDETAGLATFFEHGEVVGNTRFFLPYLSQSSTAIADRILTTGEIDLPSLAESSNCHRPLIKALAEFSHEHAGTERGLCPIT